MAIDENKVCYEPSIQKRERMNFFLTSAFFCRIPFKITLRPRLFVVSSAHLSIFPMELSLFPLLAWLFADGDGDDDFGGGGSGGAGAGQGDDDDFTFDDEDDALTDPWDGNAGGDEDDFSDIQSDD